MLLVQGHLTNNAPCPPHARHDSGCHQSHAHKPNRSTTATPAGLCRRTDSPGRLGHPPPSPVRQNPNLILRTERTLTPSHRLCSQDQTQRALAATRKAQEPSGGHDLREKTKQAHLLPESPGGEGVHLAAGPSLLFSLPYSEGRICPSTKPTIITAAHEGTLHLRVPAPRSG